MLSLAIGIEEHGELNSTMLQIAHAGMGGESSEARDSLLEILDEG